MDNSTPGSEQLLRYLEGEMTAAEKTEFEELLSADSELKKELDDLLVARHAVRSYGLKQQLAGIHGEMMRELNRGDVVRSITKKHSVFRYAIAAAASILLIFLSVQVYTFVELSPVTLYNEQYNSFELPVARGKDTATNANVEKAYAEKGYKRVIKLVKQSKPQTRKEKFLLGLSYLETQDFSNAINQFKDVIKEGQLSGQPTFKEESEYYLALAYLRNKDYDLALELMKAIHEKPQHLYHQKFPQSFIRKVKMLKWK